MLEEYLLDIGYNDKQIKSIKSNFLFRQISEDSILFTFKSLYQYLHKNGFTDEDIINVTINNQNVFNMSLENIKTKLSDIAKLGFKKNLVFTMLKNHPLILDISIKIIASRIDHLKKLGFSLEEIAINSSLLSYTIPSIDKYFDNLLKVGYSTQEVITLVTNDSEFFEEKESFFNKKYLDYKKQGMSKKLFLALTSKYPLLLRDENILYNKFNLLLEKNFLIEDIIYLLEKVDLLLDDNYQSNLDICFDLFENYQFNTDEFKTIIMKNPYILLYPSSFIEEKINIFRKYNYSLDDIKTIFLNQPIIIGFSLNNLDEKLDFYKKKGLNKSIINNYGLTFDISFILKRYSFLKENNYLLEDVGLSEDAFKNKYLSTWELLKEDLNEFIN